MVIFKPSLWLFLSLLLRFRIMREWVKNEKLSVIYYVPLIIKKKQFDKDIW